MLVRSRPAEVITCSILAEALERRALLAATAVSDFSSPASRGAADAFTLGGVNYYAFNDGFRGYELWRSDASDPHGRLVRDINTVAYDATGRTGSSHPTSFVAVNGVALFVADDGISGRELWRTDGTSAGTYRLIESRLGYDGIEPGAPLVHAPFQRGVMVFTSPDMIYTDGSAPGTRRLARCADQVFQAGGRLYWLDGATRRGVLAFDGTTLSTAFALTAGGVSGQALSLDAQGRLVFTWQALQSGTNRAFAQVIATGASVLPRQSAPHPHVAAAPSVALSLGTFGGLAFYAVPGQGVYATDGTSGGLRRIHARSSAAGPLVTAGGRAYFMLEAGAGRRRELWGTDGTAEGTRRVAQVDEQDRTAADGSTLVALGGKVAYVARANDRWEVRAFDGGSSNPQVLAVLDSGDVDVTVSNDRLFFHAGGAFYTSDGTSTGTTLVYRRTSSGGAPEAHFNVLGGKFVVVPALEHSDQIFDRASVFVAPSPPATSHRFVGGISVGDVLFLRYEESVASGPPTFELWRTDGSSAGTIKLTDQPSQRFNSFGAFGNLLVFSVDTFDDGNELFRSDGTKNGTYRLRDINPSQADANAVVLASTSKAQFFTADDGVNGRALWKTDGTVHGTVMLKGFGGRLGSIASSTSIGDALYFIAEDGMHGPQLWRSDGTPAGTRMVSADASTGSQVTALPQLTGTGALVAPAFTPGDGAELFALDTSEPSRKSIAPPYVSARTLRVFGSSDPDAIRVTRRADDPGRLDVLVNDESHAFRFGDVAVIRIYAEAGNDRVESLVEIDTAVHAGAGDDLVITAAGRDTLYGGEGSDALYGGANTDWLIGESGHDRLVGGQGRDVLWGGLDVDTFVMSVTSERRDPAIDDLLK